LDYMGEKLEKKKESIGNGKELWPRKKGTSDFNCNEINRRDRRPNCEKLRRPGKKGVRGPP